MCLGRHSSHVYICRSFPGMSSEVEYAKTVHESYKCGVRKSLGFVAEGNLMNSCSHILQTWNFGYAAYIELDVKSLSMFRIPECWPEWCVSQGRPARMKSLMLTSYIPWMLGRPSEEVSEFPSCWATLLLRTKCLCDGLLGHSGIQCPLHWSQAPALVGPSQWL